MLLATVKGTFVSTFTKETTTIHIYSEDFVKYGRDVPKTAQDIFKYVWSIPGIVEADINYSPDIIKSL